MHSEWSLLNGGCCAWDPDLPWLAWPQVQQILFYEDSVAAHLSKILTSDQHSVVISSAKVLCETVKDFVARVGKAYERATESSEESEDMAKKVGLRDSWAGLGAELHVNLFLLCLLSSALF